jgi:ABC-2 type transport system ATP-binding protein
MKTYSVQAKDLTVKFGDFTAVDKVTFNVSPGEIFGFLGANGAGKTTTIRVLCGLLGPTSGNVHVAGLDPGTQGEKVKAKVGYMSQKLTLYQDLSVAENLEFMAALRKMPEAKMHERTRELFDFIAFKQDPKTLVKDLPGGLKQEVSLAGALFHDPEVIFLDEPTAGVAPASRVRFWSLIRKLSKQGKTVFVTTHYMDEAEQCGRIALMRDGKLIALDSPAGLKKLAFKVPLLEISAAAKPAPGWQAALSARAGVESLKPYGRRWHLVPKSRAAWTALKGHLPRGFKAKVIQPSLEDVFIRLVEGKA